MDKLKLYCSTRISLIYEVIGKPEISVSHADIFSTNQMVHQEYLNFMFDDRNNIFRFRERMEALTEIRN
jgi:hypothetical protein